MTLRAQRLARTLPPAAVAAGDEAAVAGSIKDELTTMRDGMIELYRGAGAARPATSRWFVTARRVATLPREHVRASADRLAFRAVESRADRDRTRICSTAAVCCCARRRRFGPWMAQPSAPSWCRRYLARDTRASEARRVTAAYERYQGLALPARADSGRSTSRSSSPSRCSSSSAATWLGLYLAKRITRPVQQLAEGARAIGAGDLDVRLEAETGDELGSLVEAFNMMAAELQTSREKLEQSRAGPRAQEHRGRRAAPLHRDDPRARGDGRHFARCRRAHLDRQRRGRAAARPRTPAASASRRARCSIARTCGRSCRSSMAVERRAEQGLVQEITLAREDREIHLATAATVLAGDDGTIARARCSCSTTSRRSFARSAWRPGATSRGGWRTKSRTR